MKVRFKEWECDVIPAYYGNKVKGITLLEAEGPEKGCPIAKATINILPYGGPAIPDDCVWVKDWSENSGMAETLIEGRVIEPDPVAHCLMLDVVSAYKLTPEALALWSNIGG